ncbi:restriction endonuclease subunit S [Rhodopirellula sp. JC740]|uniref:Restriction endonuclease subunit S n=1 Tax=Rhodopirellula halodulae TaxID=2894198 RepID=A0ABS8NDQ3_9BACT|nr:restriction endonuclease subunit S [Rhodopirellula sp. JC740]MCC9641678.1 restriction endonuclease subunit S [Rhodopirellula sp. JC740]
MSTIESLPKGWSEKPLGELLSFQNGANADGSAYGRGVKFANVLEVLENSHLKAKQIPGMVSVPKSVIQSFRLIPGDVLFNRTSETQDEVALASVYLDESEAIFGGFVIRGRRKTDELDPVWSGYGLRADRVRKQIVALSQGAVRANIGQENLGKVIVWLPPLEEQQAIAGVLSDVDALIDSLDALIAKKRDLKQATMQQLLTGKKRLPGFSRPGKRILTEAGYLPSDWDVQTLGSLTTLMTNGFVGTATSHYTSSDGVLYIQGYNVKEDGLKFHGIKFVTKAFHAAHMKSCLRGGDLLTVQTGEVGLSTVVPDEHAGSNCHALIISRFRKSDVDSNFMRYYFNSHIGRSRLRLIETGTTMKHLNVGDMLQFVVPVPRLCEQNAIAEVLMDNDAEIKALTARRDKTQLMKTGLMQELLSGRRRLV